MLPDDVKKLFSKIEKNLKICITRIEWHKSNNFSIIITIEYTHSNSPEISNMLELEISEPDLLYTTTTFVEIIEERINELLGCGIESIWWKK